MSTPDKPRDKVYHFDLYDIANKKSKNSMIPIQDFKAWIEPIKQQIKQAQIKAALSVNKEMIALYWFLGENINIQQKNAKWGSAFIEQTSKELRESFPDVSGFSTDNIRFMLRFYQFYSEVLNIAQLAQQIEKDSGITMPPAQSMHENAKNALLNLLVSVPWGHHTLLLRKTKVLEEALFYVQQTAENNWSRAVLEAQFETGLYKRQGKAITNFKVTLPENDSDLAVSLLKDPYSFDFITLKKRVKERELEQKLVENITRFLLELGKGFAYMGRQFLLKVGSKEYRTDMLFYHTRMKCYVIIELKTTEFEPEHIGKLNFYISAVNEFVKTDTDKPTIEILLCKNKDNFEVEFALKDVNKPIGVSEYAYKELPEDIKAVFPSVDELNNELKNLNYE